MSEELKPVAFGRKHQDGWIISAKTAELGPHDEYQTPLYTAPTKREWKGLTSDDKHFLLANAWNKEQAFDGFMEAIDKFLKEKNT